MNQASITITPLLAFLLVLRPISTSPTWHDPTNLEFVNAAETPLAADIPSHNPLWDEFLWNPNEDTLSALETALAANHEPCGSSTVPSIEQQMSLFALISVKGVKSPFDHNFKPQNESLFYLHHSASRWSHRLGQVSRFRHTFADVFQAREQDRQIPALYRHIVEWLH